MDGQIGGLLTKGGGLMSYRTRVAGALVAGILLAAAGLGPGLGGTGAP